MTLTPRANGHRGGVPEVAAGEGADGLVVHGPGAGVVELAGRA